MHPWLDGAWRGIREGLDRLPPGLMFVGPEGLGKLDLAMATARALLCARPGKHGACGECGECVTFDKGMHPDLHLLTSGQFAGGLDDLTARAASRYLEDDSGRKPRQVISVNQVRSLIERLGTHSHGGGARVALIAPAGALNVNAANALLKILEEPPGDTRFLLVCSGRDSVPATVVSRVSVIECGIPAHDDALEWLESHGVPQSHQASLLALASGAPIAAARLYEAGIAERLPVWRRDLGRLLDGEMLPLSMAASIGTENTPGFLFWLEKLLGDTLRREFGRRDHALLVGDEADDQRLVNRLISRPLWDIIEKLQVYRRHQQRVVDPQLFLEDVLIAVWQEV